MARYLKLNAEKGNAVEAFNKVLSRLLEEKVVGALLVPQMLNKSVVQSLVRDAAKLEAPDPLAPVMPVNSARLVSQLSTRTTDERIGVVLRPCETRALIELVKLNQASLENLLIIGMDCQGTYSSETYKRFSEKVGDGKSPGEEFLKSTKDGGDTFDLRTACQVCTDFTPQNAQLSLLLFGNPSEGELILQTEDALGDELCQKLGLEEAEEPAAREKALAEVTGEREKQKEAVFKDIKERIGALPSLVHVFSTCIKCQNCQRACPICYCHECIFDTETMRYDPDKLLRWSKKKGILRMPVDTILFHMTRMNHMITSCVACGVCEDACPKDIPVGVIFKYLGEHVQGVFDYRPGASTDDELPLATFREEELEPR